MAIRKSKFFVFGVSPVGLSPRKIKPTCPRKNKEIKKYSL